MNSLMPTYIGEYAVDINDNPLTEEPKYCLKFLGFSNKLSWLRRVCRFLDLLWRSCKANLCLAELLGPRTYLYFFHILDNEPQIRQCLL